MEKHLILSSFRAKRQANNFNQKSNDFTIYLEQPLFLDLFQTSIIFLGLKRKF